MNGAVAERLIQRQRAIHHRLDDRHFAYQIGVVLRKRDGARPGNRRPVEQRHILHRGHAHRLLRVGTDRLLKTLVSDLQPAQAIVSGAQIQTPGAPSHFFGRRQIFVLHLIRILLDERVGIFRKAAGGGQQQPFVARALVQQALHELEAERHRGLHQFRVIIG